MRDAFATELTNLSKEREDIVLLSGDIGNRMFDEFKKVSPNKFFNCGIAEANMMSMAAGMALSGLKPFVYTITPFTTTRCLEQIRIGVAYHEAPVTIVGTGSGLSYAELGPTHHSLEDIAIIRSIPNIRVLAPSDRNELMSQLQECVKYPRPTYIRIGKKGEPEIFNKDEHKLGIAKANILKEGNDILLLGKFCFIATDRGMFRINLKSKGVREYNFDFIGSVNTIESIGKYVWMGTSEGLIRFKWRKDL